MTRRAASEGRWQTFGPFEPPGFPQRVVRTYSPPGLRKGRPGPVLYMFDGQNVFDDEGSFAGGWHAHRAVAALDPKRYHVPMIVAVDHGHERRIDELTPWKLGEIGGMANQFLDWMVGTVVPLIHDEFAVADGPFGAVVAGSSLGGLAALYAHHRHPEVFGGAISMSPSLFVGRGRLLSYIDERPRPYVSRVYLDAGGREAGGRLAKAAQRMADHLVPRGYNRKQLMYRFDARAAHNERAWRRRFPRALRFMFVR